MSASPVTGRHEAPPEPSRPATETFGEELRDAFAPRTLLLVVGVALLCLGFVLSYVGAFHDPTPHRIPVAVVAPEQVSGQLVEALDDADESPWRPPPSRMRPPPAACSSGARSPGRSWSTPPARRTPC